MPNNAECLEALPHFRNKLLRRHADPGAFVAAGMTSRDYATGITLRKRRGKSLEGEFALRLFVFEKSEVGVVAQEIQDFEGLPVEVAHLHRPVANATGRRHQGEHVLPRLPIVGGVSIGPRDTSITGTLGCFVSRTESRESGFFALSNNHVLANGDLLKIGTSIVHPAQGHVRTPTEYAFASLSETIQMKFITDTRSSERNLYDAALAVVTARFEDILTGTIRGIDRYDPTHSSEATEKMEVIKCGQTTGVTEGTVDSTHILTARPDGRNQRG